jgi:hypothetical protein
MKTLTAGIYRHYGHDVAFTLPAKTVDAACLYGDNGLFTHLATFPRSSMPRPAATPLSIRDGSAGEVPRP